MMKKFLLLVFSLALLGGQANATSLDISLNDESAQVRLASPVMPVVMHAHGRSLIDLRLLYHEPKETMLGSLGIDFVGEPAGMWGLELGVGSYLYGGVTADNRDFLALGIGGKASFAPPAWHGFGLSGRVIFAPAILTWLDAERMLEIGVGAFYAITPRIRVHLGYQHIDADFGDLVNSTVDEGFRLGFKAYF